MCRKTEAALADRTCPGSLDPSSGRYTSIASPKERRCFLLWHGLPADVLKIHWPRGRGTNATYASLWLGSRSGGFQPPVGLIFDRWERPHSVKGAPAAELTC